MNKLIRVALDLSQGVKKPDVNLSGDEKSEINQGILNLPEREFDKFVNALLEGCDGGCSEFYERVSKLQFYIGFGAASNPVVSRIWVHVYRGLESEETKAEFLNHVFGEQSRYFWNFIRALSGFCSKVDLSAPFAANWFYCLAERVKNDMAGGGVYDGVESYASSSPVSALEVFGIYEEELCDETRRSLASLILGTVRRIRKDQVSKIDDVLKSSNDVERRVCYFSSVFTLCKGSDKGMNELSTLLDQMLGDSSEQVRDVAFWIVNKGLISGDSAFKRFGLDWFKTHCSQTISGNSKHNTISSMWHLCSSLDKAHSAEINVANEIIAKVLPIANEHMGTLDRLSNYLCDRTGRIEDFVNTVFCFLPSGIENLCCLFENERFEHFRSEVGKLDLTHLSRELIFSGNAEKCRLGFLFLEHANFKPYTSKNIVKVSEDHLSIALLQFIRSRNFDQTIAKKVQFLEPFYRKASKRLQDDFVGEVVIQAVNYSQSGLAEIKRFSRSMLAKAIVNRAEQYFNNFKKTRNSPANGFSFPGYKEACLRSNTRFNTQVRKMAEEKSVFMRFAKKVQLIYGSEFSFAVGDSVSDASPMEHFEQSMELPRLEVIDPEGMAIRRLQAHK
jgi:hypothetical protein